MRSARGGALLWSREPGATHAAGAKYPGIELEPLSTSCATAGRCGTGASWSADSVGHPPTGALTDAAAKLLSPGSHGHGVQRQTSSQVSDSQQQISIPQGFPSHSQTWAPRPKRPSAKAKIGNRTSMRRSNTDSLWAVGRLDRNALSPGDHHGTSSKAWGSRDTGAYACDWHGQ